MSCIPQAVFTGILFKIGYDVFDFTPVRLYLNDVFKGNSQLTTHLLKRNADENVYVSNAEMAFIAGTTLVTVLYDLNTAVIGFTLLFYVVTRSGLCQMKDLKED